MQCLDCGKCCFDTEMQLSTEDIEKIMKFFNHTLQITEFCVQQDGYYQLKNQNGACIFYDINARNCKIYPVRPKGCEFYPLMYDLEYNQCIYDSFCPFLSDFKLPKKKYQRKCKELKKWVLETLLPSKTQ